MLSYNELKPGSHIVLEGQPYVVLEFSILRMQQRKPVSQTKVKNLMNGKTISKIFHQSDSVEEAEISMKKVKFLYNHREEFWFCEENNPIARFKIDKEIIGDSSDFLKENLVVDALCFGEKIINIKLPVKIDFKVIEAPPVEKGNTAQGGTKPAKIETGATINVPFFINEGDIIRVNTQEGKYAERVNKRA